MLDDGARRDTVTWGAVGDRIEEPYVDDNHDFELSRDSK